MYSGSKELLKGFLPSDRSILFHDYKKFSFFYVQKIRQNLGLSFRKRFLQSVTVKLSYSLIKIIHNDGSNVVSIFCVVLCSLAAIV